MDVEFADGNAFSLPAEFLRVHSPAADSKIRSVGGEKVFLGYFVDIVLGVHQLLPSL